MSRKRFKRILYECLKIILLFPFFFIFASTLYSQEIKEQSNDETVSKYEYEKLKKEYEAVVKDRDNILAQVKNLLQYKVQIKQWENKVKKLTDYNEKLKKDKEEVINKVNELEEEIKKLNQLNLEKIEQIDNLKKTIENMEIEYRIVSETKRRLKEAKEKVADLEKEKDSLILKNKKLEADNLEAKATATAYRRKIREMQEQYRQALTRNRQLEKRLEETPKKFAEMARENKILIKETALMHYNLGVFYTENKEYRRAIAEFEKALELNPNDAYAHFNLGYIYAEYMVNRSKAIEHFRHYLKLANKKDKDIDWVKKYILTWQAWEGKRPLK
jgi:tetratricopeptide (TPR) repeat protein